MSDGARTHAPWKKFCATPHRYWMQRLASARNLLRCRIVQLCLFSFRRRTFASVSVGFDGAALVPNRIMVMLGIVSSQITPSTSVS